MRLFPNRSFNPLLGNRTADTREEDERKPEINSKIDEVYSSADSSCAGSHEIYPKVSLLSAEHNLDVFGNSGNISVQVKSTQFSITEEWL